VWLIPLLLGFPFLRIYLLAEHAGCAFVPNMLANTRTTLTNRLVCFIAWNMPYHIEHHVFPTVPFHRLPHFHKRIREYSYHVENGYLAFARQYVEDISQAR